MTTSMSVLDGTATDSLPVLEASLAASLTSRRCASSVRVGIDIVAVADVADSLAVHGDRYLERVFTPHELACCRNGADGAYATESLAARFAAKEAAMKALGTGMRGVAFRELAIVRSPGGPPRLALFGRAAAYGARLHVTGAHVTITHGREIAAAVVVLTGPPL